MEVMPEAPARSDVFTYNVAGVCAQRRRQTFGLEAMILAAHVDVVTYSVPPQQLTVVPPSSTRGALAQTTWDRRLAVRHATVNASGQH